MLFEDRKFADIGSTVAHQYESGIYRIVEWADIVTVHAIPGPGIITGLKSVTKDTMQPRAILLLAEMSSQGNLCNADYARATIAMAEEHKDFVLGFISQRRTRETGADFLIFTPGVSLTTTADALGQQYNSPANVVAQGTDIIIVGRGIYKAKDVLAETIRYKEAGYNALVSRTAIKH